MRILIVCLFLITAAASAQETISSDGAATVNVSVFPSPPEFGRPATLTIEVANDGNEPLLYQLDAHLSIAMFVDGSNDVKLSGEEPTITQSEIQWPQLSVPASAAEKIELNVILRDDKEAAMMVDFVLTNMSTGDRQLTNFRIDPQWAESTSTATWSGLFIIFAFAIVAGIISGYPLSRIMFSRTGGGARGSIGAIAILIIPILAVMIFTLVLFDEIKVHTRFQETTCTATDRVVETVSTASGAMEYNMSWSEARRRALQFAAFVAVIIDLPNEQKPVVWSSGENGSSSSGPSEWVEKLTQPFGTEVSFPCWFDPDNPNSLTLDRSFSWWFYFAIIVILALPRWVAKLIGK